MLSFLKNCLGPKTNPIGIDFGTDTLKLAQVAMVNGEWKLTAAASADVPAHVRNNASARVSFFADTLRDLLTQGAFQGRSASLALPASAMYVQHLRMPKMDEEATTKALPWESRGKLPIDPSHAILRHLIAGSVFQDQEEKNEVIVMAAARDLVNQLLAAASKARLDVVGMNVEPKAIVDCFSHIYRRKTDAEVINCFVDIGCGSTRAFIARGSNVLFARVIPVGGDHFTRAVSAALSISFDEAKLLRLQLCNLQPSPSERQERQQVNPEPASAQSGESFALLGAALAAAEKHAEGSTGERRSQGSGTTTQDSALSTQDSEPNLNPEPRTPNPAGGNGNGNGKHAPLNETAEAARHVMAVEQACRTPLAKLVQELDLCRRYHEATFAGLPVNRLIFVGGEAKHKNLCQYIARELGLAAQVGDPLVRMGRISDVGMECGIDRRQPQPNWAVAIGLSLGPNKAADKAARKE